MHDAVITTARAAFGKKPVERNQLPMLSVRTKSEGLPRYLFAGRAASSGSPSVAAACTWILEA